MCTKELSSRRPSALASAFDIECLSLRDSRIKVTSLSSSSLISVAAVASEAAAAEVETVLPSRAFLWSKETVASEVVTSEVEEGRTGRGEKP